AAALRVARESGVVFPLAWNLFLSSVVLGGKGDYDDAFATVQGGLAMCEKVGEEVLYQRDLNVLGWLWGELGDHDRAIEYNRRCAEGDGKRGDPETFANAQINVGDVLIARGELALAGETLEEILRLVKNPATS